jgi:aminoglycoside phosphotransferase family enzyme
MQFTYAIFHGQKTEGNTLPYIDYSKLQEREIISYNELRIESRYNNKLYTTQYKRRIT